MAQLLKLKSVFLSILLGLYFPLRVEETLLNADHLYHIICPLTLVFHFLAHSFMIT